MGVTTAAESAICAEGNSFPGGSTAAAPTIRSSKSRLASAAAAAEAFGGIAKSASNNRVNHWAMDGLSKRMNHSRFAFLNLPAVVISGIELLAQLALSTTTVFASITTNF